VNVLGSGLTGGKARINSESIRGDRILRHVSGVRPSVRDAKVLVFSGCNSHPATGSLQPVAIGVGLLPVFWSTS
jgi:hypothetical protein